MITDAPTGTRVDEIAAGIYRISTPVTTIPGGFSFNRYLVADDAPLLFHTGPRGMLDLTREAIAAVLPVERLRYVSFSHFENDECGALNGLLAVAPDAVPVCGRINALVNGDAFDRPARVLADGETLSLGARSVRWIDAPHVPHAWECGYLFEPAMRTFLCGDLFTQPVGRLTRMADAQPATLACMHGSAWTGDGAALLRALAARRQPMAVANDPR